MKKKYVGFGDRKLTLTTKFQHFLTVPHCLNSKTSSFSLKPIIIFDKIKIIMDTPGLSKKKLMLLQLQLQFLATLQVNYFQIISFSRRIWHRILPGSSIAKEVFVLEYMEKKFDLVVEITAKYCRTQLQVNSNLS